MKISQRNISQILFATLAFFFLQSCSSSKTVRSSSVSKLYEEFFVGNEGLQYFIKPLTFKTTSEEYLELDLTLRYKQDIKDSALINVSFYNKQVIRNLSELIIRNDSTEIVANNLNLLFIERSKHLYKCRFSVMVSLLEVNKLFEQEEWEIILPKDKEATSYLPTKSTQKKITMLNYGIFDVMQ